MSICVSITTSAIANDRLEIFFIQDVRSSTCDNDFHESLSRILEKIERAQIDPRYSENSG